MKNITFPLRPGDEGAEVINLQIALILLLSKQVIEIEPGIQEELLKQLADESQGPIYKDGTMQTIILFQELFPGFRHIHPTGEVDVVTATVLNSILREMGALDDSRHCIVCGEIRQENDLRLKGIRIRAFHQAKQGLIRLGEDTSDIEGLYTIHYDLLPGLDRVDLLVTALDEDGTLLQSSELIRHAKAIEFVNLNISKV